MFKQLQDMLQNNIQVHRNLFSLILHLIISMVAKIAMVMVNAHHAMMDFGWVLILIELPMI